MLQSVAVNSGGTGDLATWLGTAGTWVIGIIAAFIAWIQYDHNKFKPLVSAYRDSKDPVERVVVRIANRGAGSGTIEHVHFLPGGHDADTSALLFDWEFQGARVQGAAFVPFLLPGLSTAQLVMLRSIDTFTPSVRARVTYGNGRRSPCVELTKVEGVILGSTMIPGVSPPTALAGFPGTQPAPPGTQSTPPVTQDDRP